MTIKKIGLSALVAATLTTGAYAGAVLKAGGFFTNDSGTGTYNTKFAETHRIDLNTTLDNGTTDGNGTVYTGFAINNGDWLVFELTGAEFNTTAEYFIKDGTGAKISVLNNNQVESNKLELKISGTPTAVDILVLSVDDSNSTDLILPQGTSANVTMKAYAKAASDGEKVYQSDTDEITIVTAETTPDLTATLICGTNGKDLLINSTSKTLLITNGTNADSGAKSTSAADCVFTIPKIAKKDIDFTYTDNNISIAFSGGDFADGNFTADATTTKTATATTETFYEEDNSTIGEGATSIDYRVTHVFNTNGDSLVDTVFQANATIFYGDTENNVTKELIATSDVMSLKLSTYEAIVRGVSVNESKGKDTHITVYNNHTAEASVDLTAYTTSEDSVTVTGVATIPAGGSTVLHASELAPQLNGLNGYTAVISVNVPSKKADVIALQQLSFGKTNLKVMDNNDDSVGN